MRTLVASGDSLWSAIATRIGLIATTGPRYRTRLPAPVLTCSPQGSDQQGLQSTGTGSGPRVCSHAPRSPIPSPEYCLLGFKESNVLR